MAKDTHTHDEAHVTVNLDTTPILFTDSISMNSNEDGITFDVMQRVGSSNQMKIVTRIGMSRSHAKKLVESLGKLLLITEGSKQTSGNN